MSKKYSYGWGIFPVAFREGSEVRRFLQDLTFSFQSGAYWSAAKFTGVDVPTKGEASLYLFACAWVKLGD